MLGVTGLDLFIGTSVDRPLHLRQNNADRIVLLADDRIQIRNNVEFPQDTTFDVSGGTGRTLTINAGGEDTYTQFTGPASGTATQIINAEGWRSNSGGARAVAWEIINFGIDSTGGADRHTARIGIMTVNNTSTLTMANPASLYIAGAPAQGTNMTLTAPHALRVAAGNSWFNDKVSIGSDHIPGFLLWLEDTNSTAYTPTAYNSTRHKLHLGAADGDQSVALIHWGNNGNMENAFGVVQMGSSSGGGGRGEL